jgi:hypothetical protein
MSVSDLASSSFQYIGSFPVDTVHSASEKVADRLGQLRRSPTVRSVLLSVSIAGVKVSSIDSKVSGSYSILVISTRVNRILKTYYIPKMFANNFVV